MSEHSEYPALFVSGLQWMWGEGYLSPGGPEEVARILSGVDLTHARVLDIGCGLGAVDVRLVEAHGAQSVVGVDVEPKLVEKAKELVSHHRLTDRITIELVEPGRLPFEPDRFDVVFSKDSMVHIEDKEACYRDIGRVLKPGGVLVFSDWFGDANPATPEMEQWLEVVGLTFSLGTIEQAADLLRKSNFIIERSEDRNRWYAEYMETELATLQGDALNQLKEVIGTSAAEQRLQSSTLKKTIVDQGQLRPGHIRAINSKQDY